jgi:hypothetical protein
VNFQPSCRCLAPDLIGMGDVADAHIAVESRATTGKTVLRP